MFEVNCSLGGSSIDNIIGFKNSNLKHLQPLVQSIQTRSNNSSISQQVCRRKLALKHVQRTLRRISMGSETAQPLFDFIPSVAFKILVKGTKSLTKLEKQFLSDFSANMANDKKPHPINFEIEWQYSDIKFKVEDKYIYANKLVLILWSPVFKAMFENNFKEKTAEKVSLPEKKFIDILELMFVLHPPNKELTDTNVTQLLPLFQEYQIEVMIEHAEEFLCNQASSVQNYLLAQKFNLSKLHESCLQYLKRAPISRLKSQPEFEQLEQSFLIQLLSEKLEKYENNVESLREVRMVLERKKPTSFPGMHLLCDSCTGARDQQVDCIGCMKNCCQKLTSILRNMEA